MESLAAWASQPSGKAEEQAGEIAFAYSSKDELLGSLIRLTSTLTEKDQEKLRLSISQTRRTEHAKAGTTSLKRFVARIKHHNLVQLIFEGQFTSHMQPIVDMNAKRVIGYEFLLRPPLGNPLFKPYELFEAAQQTGLHSFLDRSARISAIQTSARHLPVGVKRFINFLPSSIYNPDYCLTHTFQAIDRLALDPKDFVFEVVETEKIADIHHLKRIFEVYQRHGVKMALDDVGSGYATVDILSELRPDYVKIDRGLIDHCDQDKQKQLRIQDITRRAGAYGGVVLAEGLERKEEWQYCRDAGIQLAQGYLLAKPAPEPWSDDSLLAAL